MNAPFRLHVAGTEPPTLASIIDRATAANHALDNASDADWRKARLEQIEAEDALVDALCELGLRRKHRKALAELLR